MRADQLREQFAPTYLTLISILQGVLVGLVATMVDSRSCDLGIENWLRIASSVVILMAVWNEYRMGAMQFTWIPGIIDSLIPFTLGAVQLVLIRTSFLSVSNWYFALSGFYFTGIFAYENMYRRASGEGLLNADVLKALGRWRYVNPAICAGISLFAACAGSLLAISAPHRTPIAISMLITTLALNLAFLFRGQLNWKRIVRLALKNEALQLSRS